MKRGARMRLFPLYLAAALMCGCAGGAEKNAPALTLATPGPEQGTVLRGPYRAEDEPAEVIELDKEHGYWAYRSDTLGVSVDCRDYTLDDGAMGNWCIAEIVWRADTELQTPVLLPGSDAAAAAKENGWVLFAPGGNGKPLLQDGAVCTGLSGARMQRSALGMIDETHCIVIAAGQTRAGDAAGLSEAEIAALLQSEGCVTAFTLAEGADAAVIFLGEQINDPMDGAAAMADGGWAWGRTG